MVKGVKKILYRVLGQAAYLKLLHVVFFLAYDLGFLKKNYIYKYHYFVKYLVNEGDCIIDMGANLGYYSGIFSRLAGPGGKVICIEPVRPFFDTLSWAMKNKKNCVLYNYALGVENKKITMVLPKFNGNFRTGLVHIADGATEPGDYFSFETEMVRGSVLLENLPVINYIKCDIEGYEQYVLPELQPVFEKHKPVLQIETAGEQKDIVVALMQQWGYVQYSVYNNKMIRNFSHDIEPGDYIFIHSSREEALLQKLKKLNRA